MENSDDNYDALNKDLGIDTPVVRRAEGILNMPKKIWDNVPRFFTDPDMTVGDVSNLTNNILNTALLVYYGIKTANKVRLKFKEIATEKSKAGIKKASYENVSPYSTYKWTEYFNSKYGAENVSLKGTDPADFLNSALSRQELNTAPAKLKETWIQGGYKYEVRIHPAEANYGKIDSIYRVSRQNLPSLIMRQQR